MSLYHYENKMKNKKEKCLFLKVNNTFFQVKKPRKYPEFQSTKYFKLCSHFGSKPFHDFASKFFTWLKNSATQKIIRYNDKSFLFE